MNPTSRSGKGQQLWPLWAAELRRKGVPFESTITSGPGDAFQICKHSKGAQTLVAAGGDGTINEVLDGIIQSGNPSLQMGILYAGTSPDFCRLHGIPTDPIPAVQHLLTRHVRRVDAVRIEHADNTGAHLIASFACGCNIGLGASVADFANRRRCLMGDRIGTGLGVVRALLRSTPIDLNLEIDGENLYLPQVNNLSILKNPYIASGLKLNVELRPDDGKLMLIAIHGQTRLGLCKLLPAFYSGNAVGAEAVLVRACNSVRVCSATHQAIEFDGDPRGALPITTRILPRALNLIGGTP